MSLVQTAAVSPSSMPFAIVIASASVENFSTDMTGPNTSSLAMRIDMFTSPNTVGSTQ